MRRYCAKHMWLATYIVGSLLLLLTTSLFARTLKPSNCLHREYARFTCIRFFAASKSSDAVAFGHFVPGICGNIFRAKTRVFRAFECAMATLPFIFRGSKAS